MRRRTAAALLILAVYSTSGYGQDPQNVVDGFTPPSIAPGSPAGSFLLSGFETVQPYSGKLNFALPLLRIGGRGEAGYTVTLTINQTWIVDIVEFTGSCGGSGFCFGELPQHNWWTTRQPGYGPGTLFGRTGAESYVCEDNGGQDQTSADLLTRLTFTMPDGTEIELRDVATHGAPELVIQIPSNCSSQNAISSSTNRGKIFKSYDGSAVTFVSDTDIVDAYDPNTSNVLTTLSGQLHFPDGVTYVISQSKVARIRDRNGNVVELEYDGSSRITKATDALGREVTFSYNPDTITYTGFDKVNDRVITINKTGLSSALSAGQTLRPVQCTPTTSPCTLSEALFPETENETATTTPFTTTVVSEVVLPNSKKYEFRYNEYAELERVMLPTGGKIEYSWSTLPGHPASGFYDQGPNKLILRRIGERRLYADSSNLTEKTTYASIASGPGVGETETTIERLDSADTLLAKDVRTYYGQVTNAAFVGGAASYTPWEEGREFKTERYGLDDTLPTPNEIHLRTVDQTWQLRPLEPGEPTAWPGGSRDARLTQSVETLLDGNLVTKREFGYDQYNNRTSVKEYAYGSGSPGALLRETTTTFLTSDTYVYDTDLDVHIRRLPKQTEVRDGSSNLVSRTTYSYDGETLDGAISPASAMTGHCQSTGTNCVDNNGSPLPFSTAYLPRGNLTGVVRWTNVGPDVTTSQTFDIAGNVRVYTDGRSNPWTLDYASPTYAFATSLNDPKGYTQSAQYDPDLGAITQFTDRAGTVSEFEYDDPLDRMTKAITAFGSGSTEGTTTFAYTDTPSSVGVKTSTTRTSSTPQLSAETLFDGLGRAIENRTYESATTFIRTCTEYDALGRVRRTSNPTRGPCSEWTTTDYDLLSRPVLVTQPDNSTVQTDYAGNTLTVTDEAGNERQSTTDALGRLTGVVEDPNGLNYSTAYLYDPLDNLTRVTQSGQVRTFAYDGLSRLVCASNPESRTTSTACSVSLPASGVDRFTYDGNGNLLAKTNARGGTITNAYDVLNRPTTTVYTGGDTDFDNTPDELRCYDGTDDLTGGCSAAAQSTQKGRLTRVVSNVSQTDLTYDVRGRVVLSSQTTAGATYDFDYAYNRDDTLQSQTYPGTQPGQPGNVRRTVDFSYDYAGRSASAAASTPSTASYVTATSYAPHGAPSSMTLGNGLIESTQYNNRLQPFSMQAGSLLTLGFDYGTTDNNGNVLEQVITAPGLPTGSLTQTYEYDGVNRLQKVTEGAWSRTYAYDAFGNRALAPGSAALGPNQPTSTTAFDASNRLTASWAAYDFAGNQTEFLYPAIVACERRYAVYDGNNKMTGFLRPRDIGTGTPNCPDLNDRVFLGSYAYDAQGNRVLRDDGSGTTTYVYDAFGKLAAEYSTQTPSGPGGRFFRTTDHLGSTRLVTDATTPPNVVSRRDFFPFGEEIPGNGTFGGRDQVTDGGSTTSYNRPMSFAQQFTAKERDDESGLDYFGARYFGSSLGRFTSPDAPFADQFVYNPQSWNLYSYTRNNPLRYVDEDGRLVKEVVVVTAKVTATGGAFVVHPLLGAAVGVFLFADVAQAPSTPEQPALPVPTSYSGDPDDPDFVGPPAPSKKKKGRPANVPDDWIEVPSKKGGGTVYVDPNNPHHRIRVMPGNPNSPNPAQQKPYMKVQKDGKFYDAEGNEVPRNSPESHIPLPTVPPPPPPSEDDES